jgi:hypothetical protein
MNATRHGVLSVLPVLPGVESEAAWEAHRRATIASLDASGYLETILAERVASLLWRLGRVTRYETENTASLLETAEQDLDEERFLPSPFVDARKREPAAELERLVRGRLLLAPDGLEKVARYETHLERCFYRAVHEFRRLQAARAGAVTPLAPDVDVIAAAPQRQTERPWRDLGDCGAVSPAR